MRAASKSHKEFIKSRSVVATTRYDELVSDPARMTGEQALAKLQTAERARLRIYIGAAPGVGKTYSMIEDAHAFRREGIDVVVGFVETHGRVDTEARLQDLPSIPRRRIEYRGVILEEMDVEAILSRKPQLCVVDELAHTNAPGGRHDKRYQDVLDLLDAGIGVLTAVNIQHLETLNDAVSRVLRAGARIAGRLGAHWYAVYVETPREAPGHIRRADQEALQRNIALATDLGATIVRVKADKPADGLIAFAKREGITHVIFGQSARTRWEILLKGSTLNRFLEEVRDAAIQVVPLGDADA